MTNLSDKVVLETYNLYLRGGSQTMKSEKIAAKILAVDISSLDTFTQAYIESALWSSSDENDESGGEFLDENYGVDDIAPETLQEMANDCAKFQNETGGLWAKIDDFGQYTVEERAAHDFWLTRNGHGAGFWDGDWPEDIEDALTDAAEKFGEYGLYIGDDGKIYGSAG